MMISQLLSYCAAKYLFTGSYLLSGMFQPPVTTGKDLIAMDNTIYQFTDEKRNNFFFYISPSGQCIMEYDPLPQTGHGQDVSVSAVTMADYAYLIGLLKVAVNDRPVVGVPPGGQAATLTIDSGKPVRYEVDCTTATGRTLRNLISGYQKKYLHDMPGRETDTILIKGRIKEVSYGSKKGKLTDINEYFFLPERKAIAEWKLGKEYFIKLREGKVLKADMARFAGKTVMIKGVFKRGLWDATDSAHASRFGDYVVALEISSQ